MSQLRSAVAEYVAGWTASELGAQVGDLRQAYRDRSGSVELDSEARVAAYVAYRMPATHAAVRAVLAATVDTVPGLAPRTVLDAGGGTGAAAWAAADAFPRLETVTVVDRSAHALAAGRSLASGAEHPALRDVRWRRASILADLPEERFDLAVGAYVLGEIPGDGARRLVTGLAGRAETVILVEPGTPAGYQRILAARRTLLDAGMGLAAPCPHRLDCPMIDDWCHFSVRFERSALARRLKDAHHGYEDEKYAYIAATRLAVGPPASRIVRHPVYRKGLVSLQLCTDQGTIQQVEVGRASGSRYREAREASWGDSWG